MYDTYLIFVVDVKYNFFFCHEDNDTQPQDIYCSSYTTESVNGDKVFPSAGDTCARGVLLLVEVECCGLGVNSE